MRRNRRTSTPLICRIDVTAFVAVMIVLVVVMMNKPVRRAISADMPKVSHSVSQPKALREDAMVVAIMRDGICFFDGHRITPSNLPAEIRDRLSLGAERKIYIMADARAKYAPVIEIVDAIALTGIQDVAFFVEQRPSGSPSIGRIGR